MQAPFRTTARDLEILGAIARFKTLDRDHIQRLFFASNQGGLRHCNRRLAGLRAAGLVTAVPQLIPQIISDRPMTIARPRVYTLTIEGRHAIGEKGRKRQEVRGLQVLEHERLVTSLLIHALTAAKENGWVAEIGSAEPVRAGQRLVKPDGQVTITRENTNVGLLEADRGTEGKTKFIAKAQAYLDVYGSKQLHQTYGKATRILVVTRARTSPVDLLGTPEANAARVLELLRFLGAAGAKGELFWVTTQDEFLSTNPLTAPIWRTPANPTPHSLFRR